MPIQLQHSDGATATIHEHGAHVTSWRTADGVERLFLSQRAEFQAGAAIRGGVPIIFPQFAGLGSLPKHGFARTMPWLVLPQVVGNRAGFQLQSNDATRAIWPYDFAAEYTVTVSDDALTLALSIRNTDRQPFSFTTALHTYLRVQDIAAVDVIGLQHLHYSDSAADGLAEIETAPSLQIDGEVDRIYFDAVQPIKVNEPNQRSMQCTAQGFADAVIWNPGAVKAAALKDLERDSYRRMLCVEAAAIKQPIELSPGAIWSGVQRLNVL